MLPDGSDDMARFIPACAGSSAATPSGANGAAVHPRVRGEQLINLALSFGIDGSSPRARGAE